MFASSARCLASGAVLQKFTGPALHASVLDDLLLSKQLSLLYHHSVPAGIVLLQADITDLAAQQPPAQPTSSHQLNSQLQDEPGSVAAGTMQTAVPLAINKLRSGSSRLGLHGMAEAQPVRESAADDWLSLRHAM